MIGAIRAGVAGLTVGQRVTGAAITLALWLAPAAAVWLHMSGKASAASDLGAATARAECAQAQSVALAKAIEDARREWKRAQAEIDSRAQADSSAIADDLAAARRAADRLSVELKNHAQRNPLPADCRADPERVRLYNDARRGGAAEG